MKIALCVFVVLCLITVSTVLSLESPKACAEFAADPMEGFVKDRVRFRTVRPDGNQDITDILIKSGVPEIKHTGVSVFDQPNKGHYKYISEDYPEYNGTEYLILQTDYDSYSIEYACENVSGGGSKVQLSILSRTPTVTFITQSDINKVIDAHHFNTTAIRTMNIASCPSQLAGNVGSLAVLLKLVTDLLGGVLGLLGK